MSGGCGCGHPWSTHDEHGCGVKNGHDEYCACSAVPPEKLAEMLVDRRTRELLYPCPDHRRYRVLRPPKTTCQKCWTMWVRVHASRL